MWVLDRGVRGAGERYIDYIEVSQIVGDVPGVLRMYYRIVVKTKYDAYCW